MFWYSSTSKSFGTWIIHVSTIFQLNEWYWLLRKLTMCSNMFNLGSTVATETYIEDAFRSSKSNRQSPKDPPKHAEELMLRPVAWSYPTTAKQQVIPHSMSSGGGPKGCRPCWAYHHGDTPQAVIPPWSSRPPRFLRSSASAPTADCYLEHLKCCIDADRKLKSQLDVWVLKSRYLKNGRYNQYLDFLQQGSRYVYRNIPFVVWVKHGKLFIECASVHRWKTSTVCARWGGTWWTKESISGNNA